MRPRTPAALLAAAFAPPLCPMHLRALSSRLVVPFAPCGRCPRLARAVQENPNAVLKNQGKYGFYAPVPNFELSVPPKPAARLEVRAARHRTVPTARLDLATLACTPCHPSCPFAPPF